MGSRFLITGVQLGMLEAFIQGNNKEQAQILMDDIKENQILFHSESEIAHDIAYIKEEIVP